VEARRRPQDEVRYLEQINKTIERAKAEGKAHNTIRNFNSRLRQLSRFSDLMNPNDVKNAIAYSKITNASKTCFVLAYEWFTSC
jgi:hypothetical protein